MGRSIFVWAGRILAGHQPRNEGDRHEPVRPIQAGQLAHARSLRQVAHSTDQQITMSKGTRNYELAATIANALVHHQQAAEVGDALTYLTALADGGPGDTDAGEEWLNEQIWGITQELGDYSITEPT